MTGFTPAQVHDILATTVALKIAYNYGSISITVSCLIVRVYAYTISYFLGSNPIKKLTKSPNLYWLYIYNNNRY